MRKSVFYLGVLLFSLLGFSQSTQINEEPVALGLPGDNLNLYAVLDVFQHSRTLEDFERAINKKENNINNLDLNNDNQVDYIAVYSFNEGNYHTIVLRVALNSEEYQDVAVIEVTKNKLGKVIVQLIGDEVLYGKDYVIEPSSGQSYSETINPGYIGDDYDTTNMYLNNVVYVNSWPIVAYLYSPSFSVYFSSWYWGYYPFYWRPWAPVRYYNYWRLHNHYYKSPYYHRTIFVRYPIHYSYYLKRRTTSQYVYKNRLSPAYRNTYEGRTYKRPATPIRRNTNTSRTLTPRQNQDRRSVPSNRSGTTRTKDPSKAQQATPARRSGNATENRRGEKRD